MNIPQLLVEIVEDLFKGDRKYLGITSKKNQQMKTNEIINKQSIHTKTKPQKNDSLAEDQNNGEDNLIDDCDSNNSISNNNKDLNRMTSVTSSFRLVKKTPNKQEDPPLSDTYKKNLSTMTTSFETDRKKNTNRLHMKNSIKPSLTRKVSDNDDNMSLNTIEDEEE